MKKIRVYDIQYLGVVDPEYRYEYSSDYDLTEEQTREWIENLENNTELIWDFSEFSMTPEEWNDPDYIDEIIVDLIEQDTCEYFTGFDWEYLED